MTNSSPSALTFYSVVADCDSISCVQA
jgi:hypothetical protein